MQNVTFLENVKVYVGFDDDASAALREAHPLVAPHFGAIIDDFYDTIEAHPGARAAITGGAAQIQRLKRSLLQWIDEIFRGPHDEAYFQRRARIGRVHVQISLPQMYMLTAMDRIRVRSVDVLRVAPALDPSTARRMITALHQILDIELAIMLETYRDDLLAKNRTAERLATIGQFAAGIGHELRNPLGVVESSAFLVSRRLEQLQISDPSLSRHMEKIVAEVQQIEQDHQRSPRARAQQAPQEAPRRGRRVHRAGRRRRRICRWRSTFRSRRRRARSLDIDPDQLARVLTNLLINASQAMGGAGHVWVEARREGARSVVARARRRSRAFPRSSGGASSRRCSRRRPRGTGSAWPSAGASPRRTPAPSPSSPPSGAPPFEITIPDQAPAGAA